MKQDAPLRLTSRPQANPPGGLVAVHLSAALAGALTHLAKRHGVTVSAMLAQMIAGATDAAETDALREIAARRDRGTS